MKKPIVGYYIEGELYCPQCFGRIRSAPKFPKDMPFQRVKLGQMLKGGHAYMECLSDKCGNMIYTDKLASKE